MLHKYKHAVVNTNENFLLNSYINSDSDKVGVHIAEQHTVTLVYRKQTAASSFSLSVDKS